MTLEETLTKLQEAGSEENLLSMAKAGINVTNAFGVQIPAIRAMAKEIRIDHELALELWATGKHEARILATMIADKKLADSEFLEKWVLEINSWDLVDQFCTNLASKTETGKLKVYEWAVQNESFVKRAGFALIACYAVKDKDLSENEIESFCTLILNECDDSRNYVRKGVSWALRNIGKRDDKCRKIAVTLAKHMKDEPSKTARATATEVLTELNSRDVKISTKFRK